MRVFRHFAADPELARRRYRIVREIPGLRDREIVTVFRYERLFDQYLRDALPGLDPLDAVGFAALVTAVHNHVLRRLMRGARVPASVLRRALDDALRRYGVGPDSGDAAGDDLIVAAFPAGCPLPRSPAVCAPRSRTDPAPPPSSVHDTPVPFADCRRVRDTRRDGSPASADEGRDTGYQHARYWGP